jgi:cytochrome c oxidase cbb3-type subunit 3
MRTTAAVVSVVAAAAIAAAAGGWIATTSRQGGENHQLIGILPAEGPAALVPNGDLAGAAAARLPSLVSNPFEGNADAVNEGHRLYVRMNCADCHGYTAEGAMGPDLTDTYWRYGGTPVEIFKSIYEGRPQGMPAWGRALPRTSIWQLTAYIQSLGGSFPASGYHAGLQGDLSQRRDRKASKTGATGLEGQ